MNGNRIRADINENYQGLKGTRARRPLTDPAFRLR